VSWRGNANQWMRNAKSAGVKVWSTPVPGSIVQFSGRGYNRYYGHVGIVADVTDDSIIVKDMNYRGLYEVTIRRVPINDDTIDGYIYID
jgi:surface antigen